MSIQSSINQGITTMSLLLSQTPMAEEARTRRRIDTQNAVERGTRGEKVATETEKAEAVEEVKTEGEAEREAKAKERTIGEAKGLYETHKGYIRPMEELGSGTHSVDLRAQERTRRAAAKAATSLNELEPDKALPYAAAEYTAEAEELRRRAEDLEKKSAAKKAKDAAKTKKKTKIATDALTGGET